MKQDIKEEAIAKKAARLIRIRPSMTLATTFDGDPWAAPVYYAGTGRGLYFFSNPQSRHIQDAIASGNAACAVYEESTDWENLRGLQMSGVIRPVPAGMEAAAAVSAYVRKFPFIRAFFKAALKPDLAGFQRLFHAGLYCFVPRRIYYTDNSFQFGFRRQVRRKALFP